MSNSFACTDKNRKASAVREPTEAFYAYQDKPIVIGAYTPSVGMLNSAQYVLKKLICIPLLTVKKKSPISLSRITLLDFS
jgi:hypothetical protein